MYRLSKLPIEILYIIASHLSIQDLINVARLNIWYGYRLSSVLSERIKELVEKDGWRIHIDILATFHASSNGNIPSFPYSTELLLLGEFSRVNPVTLTLEFLMCPLDDIGFGAVKDAPVSDRSLVMYEKIRTTINIVAYFAQISSNQRLQHVNQAGGTLLNDRILWEKLKGVKQMKGAARMSAGFKVNYELLVEPKTETLAVIEKHVKSHRMILDRPAILSFHTMYVTPEWWIRQMETPFFSPSEQQQDCLVHGLW
ncbi:hypothetical protein RMATCC62417_06145 [Rhizopus microsporus]|nr:hypothetical protein RMATCC62417_06145 [Rhizopus microsporus]